MGAGRIMAQRGHRPPPPEPPGLSGPEVILLILAALWLVLGGIWLLRPGFGAGVGGGLAALVLWLLPPAVMALATVQSRAIRLLRGEGARLAWAVAELQSALQVPGTPQAQAQAQTAAPEAKAPPAAEPPAALPSVEAAAEPAPAEPSPDAAADITPAPDTPPPAEPQLALAAPGDEPLIDRADLVRALHFPEDESDSEGFAALRRALGNREIRQLIQAAQDVLTLLSQNGVYMDDLTPDQARPEIWRRFARGERGRAVAQLGGIHDRAALGAVMRRMRDDTIFRDTAHHFLRLFDRILSQFEPEAADEELIALSTTRSSRAFMLIGRAAGVFG